MPTEKNRFLRKNVAVKCIIMKIMTITLMHILNDLVYKKLLIRNEMHLIIKTVVAIISSVLRKFGLYFLK